MKWIEALKLYNAKNGKWIIPRKGSPEYDEVRAIMAKEVEGGMLKALRERELGNKKPMEKMEEKQRRKALMDKLVNNMLEALKSGTHSLDAMHAFLAKPGLRPVDDYEFSDAEKAEMKDNLDSEWQMWGLSLSDEE